MLGRSFDSVEDKFDKGQIMKELLLITNSERTRRPHAIDQVSHGSSVQTTKRDERRSLLLGANFLVHGMIVET